MHSLGAPCAEVGIESLQKLLLEFGSVNNLESQVSGFPCEEVDFPLAVLCLVKLRPFIDELHSEAQHAVHQSFQFGRHGLGRHRSPQLGSQSTELRSQISFAQVQAAIFKAMVTRFLVGSRPFPM